MVGRVDVRMHVGARVGEEDVAFRAAGTDMTGTAGLRSAIPRVVRAVGRADVQIVPGTDNPHRHVGAQGAVPAAGRELQFLGPADAVEIFIGPGGHDVAPLVVGKGGLAATACAVGRGRPCPRTRTGRHRGQGRACARRCSG
ncbi:hypothetical protein FRAHR75_1820003 [Frankia sp. Hr75.2]|nr:hypothetical protein FRAHR75_1820003 [Frankia sp. Hr75.2]